MWRACSQGKALSCCSPMTGSRGSRCSPDTCLPGNVPDVRIRDRRCGLHGTGGPNPFEGGETVSIEGRVCRPEGLRSFGSGQFDPAPPRLSDGNNGSGRLCDPVCEGYRGVGGQPRLERVEAAARCVCCGHVFRPFGTLAVPVFPGCRLDRLGIRMDLCRRSVRGGGRKGVRGPGKIKPSYNEVSCTRATGEVDVYGYRSTRTIFRDTTEWNADLGQCHIEIAPGARYPGTGVASLKYQDPDTGEEYPYATDVQTPGIGQNDLFDITYSGEIWNWYPSTDPHPIPPRNPEPARSSSAMPAAKLVS